MRQGRLLGRGRPAQALPASSRASRHGRVLAFWTPPTPLPRVDPREGNVPRGTGPSGREGRREQHIAYSEYAGRVSCVGQMRCDLVALLLCVVPVLGAAVAPRPAVRVLGLQIAAASGKTEHNLQRAEALIRANPGFDLYVLPELSCHGYDDEVLASLHQHAQDTTGAIASFFCRCARNANAHICFGFIRRSEDGKCTICQAVAAPSGTLELVYDKMHL